MTVAGQEFGSFPIYLACCSFVTFNIVAFVTFLMPSLSLAQTGPGGSIIPSPSVGRSRLETTWPIARDNGITTVALVFVDRWGECILQETGRWCLRECL